MKLTTYFGLGFIIIAIISSGLTSLGGWIILVIGLFLMMVGIGHKKTNSKEVKEVNRFDKQSRTEKLLLAEMYNIGLEPKPQHKISEMTVDFAFPNKMLVVEINGPHHNTPKQKEIDRKRWYVLDDLGWRCKSFRAESVHKYPAFIAQKIKEELEK